MHECTTLIKDVWIILSELSGFVEDISCQRTQKTVQGDACSQESAFHG